jgi:hypothetical protein
MPQPKQRTFPLTLSKSKVTDVDEGERKKMVIPMV